MAYAVIDLGSNSVRLSVYEHKNNEISKVFSHKEVAGLAGYVSGGRLSEAGVLKACDVLNVIKKLAARFAGPSDTYLFAAASLRNIRNREDAVETIARETLLVPYVLEGEEEAALGFAGAAKYISFKSGLMIDIGGASTELALIENYEPVKLASMPIGCLNLSVNYVKRIIPTEQEDKQIRAAIKEHLSALGWEPDSRYPLMLGSGGTMRAALKLARSLCGAPPGSQEFSASHVKEIADLLRKEDDSIYLKIYQTIPERLMTIATGFAILQQVIRKFGCETVAVSKFGVREGYLVDRVLMTNGKHFVE